ncbi:MAG: 3,4-dihydroxy-2-butanone-4-phosphate synthase [Acidobacteriota bacterium]
MSKTDSTGDTPRRFIPIPEAIERFRRGEMVIIVDDEDRENEGDLVVAAEKITPEAINFMAKHGRGLICLALTHERCQELDLPLMVDEDRMAPFGTAFTVSIEARHGVTTGISAGDRAETVRVAMDSQSKPSDLSRPGHIFPVRARPGGVLKRAGHTEASTDLAVLAGLQAGAVICEIMNDDGSMARVPDLVAFGEEHDLPLLTVQDLIRHRMRHETLVERVAAPTIKSAYGEMIAYGYRSPATGEEHVAFVLGEIRPDEPVLVRVHSQDLTSDLFGAKRRDGGSQLHAALDQIAEAGSGVLLYLLQEGRGIGLMNKLAALELQEQGHDTVEANERLGFRPDERDYGIGCQILRDLGVRKMRLMTNNMGKYIALAGFGLEIVERLPLQIPATDDNRDYLETKRDKLGHKLDVT